MEKTKYWIEAMRLRTLPVSVAGVIAGTANAIFVNEFKAVPALLCLIFAILAQIASNFANEYYDFRAGLDKPGRVGPRRGVTEGDITPARMKRATFITLALACLTGCGLIFYGGWWLIAAGVIIALGALAYSAGPYPLSRHGLGEVAVLMFFGVIPVNLTYYVQTLSWSQPVLLTSLAIGLMGVNVLVVNNYRDCDEDREVGKHTLCVIIGRRLYGSIYLIAGFLAVAIMVPEWILVSPGFWIIPVTYLSFHIVVWMELTSHRVRSLNPLLGATAILMLLYSFGWLFTALAS